MTILFTSYWSLAEGLTQATVIPHLKILAGFKEIEKVILITIERDGSPANLDLPKVEHQWIETSVKLRHKLTDKARVQGLLRKIYIKQKLDWVITRGTPAARLVMSFCDKKKIPLSIESHEPHAEYMAEAGIWKKTGIKYRVQKAAELRLPETSTWLVPLTEEYRKQMIKDGADPEKILVSPCCVEPDLFRFSEFDRNKVRTQLGFHDQDIVGVYTGKYGGIYLTNEVIQLMKLAKDFYGEHFKLIVLSPDWEIWKDQLITAGFSENTFYTGLVKQQEIPAYLSAADFAYSLHKPTPSKIAISPIKNAEYLANNLPIVMPWGIGDDSMVVDKHQFGVVFDVNQPIDSNIYAQLKPILETPRQNRPFYQWTQENRSFSIIEKNYRTILRSLM